MESINPTAAELVAALVQRNQTISFCESLSAGLAAATLATVPGASAVLRGGLVVYATDLKGTLAGVGEDVLAAHGPVSPATAREMARGARRVCGSDWAVALTGVAGPETQDGHPVGEVWVGLAGPRYTASFAAAELVPAEAGRYTLLEGAPEPVRVLAGGREEIRRAAVEAALVGAIRGVREQN
ncbi:CinA family protein [Corynebacterium liangguodongii]|uniref:CinA family protein n=1 Tax=Corynebacterium liangguodongii TaxID=2079535 RepID=A0A2S0WEJ7_9CORY|nr:CinA family protein [Corynebacterium liangguodongii]AWB84203.1 CinA family protein [Corynebacterium liangguodongii]PWC00213.1 CinA family protein [Corynebacterium liangguodongii]